MQPSPHRLHYASAPHSRTFSRFAVLVTCISAVTFGIPGMLISIASETQPYPLYELIFASETRMYVALFTVPLICLVLSVIAQFRIERQTARLRGRGLTTCALLLSFVNLGCAGCAGEVIKGIGC